MLTFRERMHLSRTDRMLAELELDAAIATALAERQLRIEDGWNRLAAAVFDANVDELEWR